MQTSRASSRAYISHLTLQWAVGSLEGPSTERKHDYWHVRIFFVYFLIMMMIVGVMLTIILTMMVLGTRIYNGIPRLTERVVALW